jgi:acyl carrier protein
MSRDSVVRDVYAAVESMNELRPPDDQLPCHEETVLFGPGGGLDSLGLVSLVLEVEESVNRRFGANLVLADEHAMGRKRNPFRDVRSLVDYIMDRLREYQACPSAP